jgi:protein TonB
MLPIVFMLAAFATLIWRQQHPAETSAVLNRISTEALALISGGPLLVERQLLAIDLPRPEIQPRVSMAAIHIATPTATVAPNPVRAEHAENSAAAPVSMPRGQSPPTVATNLPQPSPPIVAAVPEPIVPPSNAEKLAPLHVVPPVYPPHAMSSGVEGAVELEYQVDAGGNVAQIRVVSAHPSGVFEAAAKAALSAWRFPASGGGKKQIQNFAFSLHGRSRLEEQCQTVTGTLICRRPGD